MSRASDSVIDLKDGSRSIKSLSSDGFPYFTEKTNDDTEEIHSTTTAALLRYNSLVSGDNETESFSETESGSQNKEYLNDVKLVQYDPSEKPQRLGRPRKHLGSKSMIVEDSSSDNYNQSIISKFRLDSKPLEGPGSRGGIKSRISPKGKVTSSILRKRKQQSVLSFSVDESKNVKPNKTSTVPLNEGSDTPKDILDDLHPKSDKSKSPNTDPIIEIPRVAGSANMEKKARTYKRRAISNINTMKTSRTTFVNNRNKNSRQLPGPLISLNYALYDENALQAQQNEKAAAEKIALGYPVKASRIASHIVFIISFLNKFKSLLEVNGIGPQTIERGLGLTSQEDDSSPNSDSISIEMNYLFLKLMGLILNRKKTITSHSKAIVELKSLVSSLGLPKEWKKQPNDKAKENEPFSEPVDLQKPYIHYDSTFDSDEESIRYNPFVDPEFESKGLSGIHDPFDRLILLKTLVQWTLTSSNAVKLFISNSVLKQDVPGDKDTYYASRSILKGFKNTEVTKKEAEAKLAKRKSSDDDTKYVDPTSNPLDHTMNIRILEEICGDIGFQVGRFYLCRMADESNGGLASIKKMRTAWSGNVMSSHLPSEFKIYVQDVYRTLVECLANAGIEFDESGEEVKSSSQNSNVDDLWYEVASNGAELSTFVEYLAKRLGIDSHVRDDDSIPMTSMIYKPTLYLYEYFAAMLPLIIKQETMPPETQIGDKRSSRKQTINYSDKAASRLYEEYMETDEFVEGNGDEDDDYEESDLEEVEQMDKEEDVDYID
ncbi:hypothetical protein DFJ63DRAFT_289557 [Scheffersomyces coipomensis]|uniref:uncharacterized protein n=1 Tax=Scheffersomyces coipomensis TaxID=1788519 RepID=UPI00315D21B2